MGNNMYYIYTHNNTHEYNYLYYATNEEAEALVIFQTETEMIQERITTAYRIADRKWNITVEVRENNFARK